MPRTTPSRTDTTRHAAAATSAGADGRTPSTGTLDGTTPAGATAPAPAAESVGARIREFRRERGWTQDDLAQATGVSRSAVAQWETDRAGQIRGNITRIADALGISVEVLLHGAGSRGSAQAEDGTEWALLRLYRECLPEDRDEVLRMARSLARRRAARDVPEAPG